MKTIVFKHMHIRPASWRECKSEMLKSFQKIKIVASTCLIP